MQPNCPNCISNNNSSESRSLVVRCGFFIRAIDNSLQQRYRCKSCGKSFSEATFDRCYRQKKRHLNKDVFLLFCSGASQRRLSLLLNANRKTIVRKFIFIGKLSQALIQKQHDLGIISREIEFDDLETFEHSKLKPLSVTMAVESKTRRILGLRVSKMPAKGLLAARSRKKYGKRVDERPQNLKDLLNELRSCVAPNAIIKSDQNPHYPKSVKELFPKATHKTFKGRRGCVVGQGELKAGGFDPLFSLNHSFAMLRANINRLFRRTWNTTKRPDRLELHIAMYVAFHNFVLIKKIEPAVLLLS